MHKGTRSEPRCENPIEGPLRNARLVYSSCAANESDFLKFQPGGSSRSFRILNCNCSLLFIYKVIGRKFTAQGTFRPVGSELSCVSHGTPRNSAVASIVVSWSCGFIPLGRVDPVEAPPRRSNRVAFYRNGGVGTGCRSACAIFCNAVIVSDNERTNRSVHGVG